jgi:hypothetical protein
MIEENHLYWPNASQLCGKSINQSTRFKLGSWILLTDLCNKADIKINPHFPKRKAMLMYQLLPKR